MTFDVIAKHNANKQTRPKLTSLTEKKWLKHLSNFRFGGFEVVVGASPVYTPVSSCFLSNWPKLKPIFRSSFFHLFFWFIEVFFFNKMWYAVCILTWRQCVLAVCNSMRNRELYIDSDWVSYDQLISFVGFGQGAHQRGLTTSRITPYVRSFRRLNLNYSKNWNHWLKIASRESLKSDYKGRIFWFPAALLGPGSMWHF